MRCDTANSVDRRELDGKPRRRVAIKNSQAVRLARMVSFLDKGSAQSPGIPSPQKIRIRLVLVKAYMRCIMYQVT